MAKQLQIRGGTTVQHSTFTGALREITIDTDKDVVVVHDGTTVGGFPLAKQTSVDSKVTKVTSTDNAVVRFNGTTGEVQNSGVVIDDNNNVGIGVAPSAWYSTATALEFIHGTSGQQSNGGYFTSFNAYQGSDGNWRYKSTDEASRFVCDIDGAHRWYTAPSGTAGNPISWTNAMTLDSNGYLYFGGDIADATTTGIRRGSAGQLILRASNSGLYHQANTSYYLITTAGGSTSDITLKKDIEVIPNSLNKILNLKGVYYEFIEEQLCTADKGKQIGVIAQDVEQEFPEIVLTNEDGIKTVRYDRLIAPMIEAIKEQQEIIKDLKARIEVLEAK